MNLVIALIAMNLVSGLIIYLIARRNGKLEERDRVRSAYYENSIKVQNQIVAEQERSNGRMEKMETAVYGKDIHLLPDGDDNNQLNRMWQDRTDINVQTDTESVAKPKTKGT